MIFEQSLLTLPIGAQFHAYVKHLRKKEIRANILCETLCVTSLRAKNVASVLA